MFVCAFSVAVTLLRWFSWNGFLGDGGWYSMCHACVCRFSRLSMLSDILILHSVFFLFYCGCCCCFCRCAMLFFPTTQQWFIHIHTIVWIVSSALRFFLGLKFIVYKTDRWSLAVLGYTHSHIELRARERKRVNTFERINMKYTKL